LQTACFYIKSVTTTLVPLKTSKILAKKTKSLPIWLRVLSEMIIGILAIVYGIAELDWWEESVNKPIQQQYTVIEFECIDEDYVLYYRNVGDKLGLI